MNCTTPTRWPRPSMRKRQSERGRRFALAGAGMDDKQSLLDRLFRRPRRPAPPCAWPSWRDAARLRFCRLFASSVSLTATLSRASGNPATTSTTRSASAAMRWLRMPCSVAKAPAERMIRHDAGADFVGDQHDRRRGGGQCLLQMRGFRVDVASASMRFDSHSVRQSTSTGIGAGLCSAAAIPRGVSTTRHSAPRRARCRAMRSRHFIVARFRGRHIEPRRRQRRNHALGIAALARTSAAEDESNFC